MIDFQGSILVPGTAESAFSFVSNPENIPRYQPKVVSARMLSPGPLGQGSRFEEVVAMGPGKMRVSCEVVAWQAPQRVAFVARGSAVHCDAEYSFEPTPDGTLVRIVGQARLQGWRAILEPLMRGQVRAGVPAELALIRQALVPATPGAAVGMVAARV